MARSPSGLPVLAPVLPGEERLIDSVALHRQASSAGRAERYGRGQTPHTVHVWWARRPHSAMRALVFAALAPQEAELELDDLLRGGAAPDQGTLARARRLVVRPAGRPPRLLDMFGGGATIGLEAARLGADTDVVEANELAVFINRCHLVLPRRADPAQLETMLRESGHRVLQDLAAATDSLFPLRHQRLGQDSRARPTTYLWTYSTRCERCGYRFFLTRRPWLSRTRGKRLALAFSDGGDGQQVAIGQVGADHAHPSCWVGRTTRVRCPACGAERAADVRTCRDEPVAVVVSRRGAGKEVVLAPADAVPPHEILTETERVLLADLGVALPTTRLPRWSGVVNPALYGIETHADFLNPRQRLVVLHLIRVLRRERGRLDRRGDLETARYVVALLSGLVDQVLDWSCRLSMWIPQNEQVGRAFCGPGVAMLWDYAEVDPALRGPACLQDKLERVVRGAVRPDELRGQVEVVHGRAQSLPFESGRFDAVVTDPPYYDNLFYNVLADFLYCWKRLILRDIFEDIFVYEATSSAAELVASPQRSGDPETAHRAYCAGLEQVLREAGRVLRPGGLLALVYGHGALDGWEALTRSFHASQLVVTGVQPLTVERRQRPRAMASEAVNTCFVFVARKRMGARPALGLDEVVARLEKILDGPWPAELTSAGWRDQDTALACFAQGVGLLTSAESGAESGLARLEDAVRARFAGFRLTRRRAS